MQRARHFYAILALESFFFVISPGDSPTFRIREKISTTENRLTRAKQRDKKPRRKNELKNAREIQIGLRAYPGTRRSSKLAKALSSTRSFSLFTPLTIRERCVRGSSPGYHHAPLCYFRRSHDRSIRSRCAILIQLNRAKYKLH